MNLRCVIGWESQDSDRDSLGLVVVCRQLSWCQVCGPRPAGHVRWPLDQYWANTLEE